MAAAAMMTAYTRRMMMMIVRGDGTGTGLEMAWHCRAPCATALLCAVQVAADAVAAAMCRVWLACLSTLYLSASALRAAGYW